MSSSESSWPDEMWLEPVRDHVRRRATRSPGAASSAWGGSSVSGSSVDQVRHDIRNLKFYISGSDDSRSHTPVPTQNRMELYSREERRWTRLYQVLTEEVQRKLINLRLQINSMTDVARLPTEILCTIFLLIANDPTVKTHRPLITLTQVCRHWRKVAIALPMIWTNIYPSMSVRDVARGLRRSNGLPLDFTISGTQGTAEHWEHFHEHIGRSKRITIKDIPPEWIADLQPWLDNPAHILEELVLHAAPAKTPISSELGLTFFDQATPMLWKVRLDTIILPRTSFHLFLNITHFEFIFQHGPKIGCQLPSHKYILDMLSCAPMLEDATFERTGTEHLPYFRTFPVDYVPSRVSLENLKRLTVQGLAPAELTWLEYLDVPVMCCIKLGIDLAHHVNLKPLIHLLDNPANGLRPLSRVQETMFTGSAGSTPEKDKWAVHLWDPNSLLAFSIVFRSPAIQQQTETIIWLLCMSLFKRYTPRCLAFSTLSERFISSAGIYIRILMGHPTITDLAFDDCAFVEDALQLLIASEKSSSYSATLQTNNPLNDVVCPNLAYLALSRCRDLEASVILELARVRDIRGKTLRKIRIKECKKAHRRVVTDLRWLAEEVEWDLEKDWDGFSTMADLDGDELLDREELWEVPAVATAGAGPKPDLATEGNAGTSGDPVASAGTDEVAEGETKEATNEQVDVSGDIDVVIGIKWEDELPARPDLSHLGEWGISAYPAYPANPAEQTPSIYSIPSIQTPQPIYTAPEVTTPVQAPFIQPIQPAPTQPIASRISQSMQAARLAEPIQSQSTPVIHVPRPVPVKPIQIVRPPNPAPSQSVHKVQQVKPIQPVPTNHRSHTTQHAQASQAAHTHSNRQPLVTRPAPAHLVINSNANANASADAGWTVIKDDLETSPEVATPQRRSYNTQEKEKEKDKDKDHTPTPPPPVPPKLANRLSLTTATALGLELNPSASAPASAPVTTPTPHSAPPATSNPTPHTPIPRNQTRTPGPQQQQHPQHSASQANPSTRSNPPRRSSSVTRPHPPNANSNANASSTNPPRPPNKSSQSNPTAQARPSSSSNAATAPRRQNSIDNPQRRQNSVDPHNRTQAPAQPQNATSGNSRPSIYHSHSRSGSSIDLRRGNSLDLRHKASNVNNSSSAELRRKASATRITPNTGNSSAPNVPTVPGVPGNRLDIVRPGSTRPMVRRNSSTNSPAYKNPVSGAGSNN